MKFLLSNLLFFLANAIALAESPTAKSSDGPEIELDRASSDIFPESWLTPIVDAKAKADLTMTFYEKVDAKFSHEFFVSLRKP